MTWLLAERSRVMRFHDADRDTLADTYRAYIPGLVAFLRSATPSDSARVHAPQKSALATDDVAVETLRRAFEKEMRLRFDGPSPYATALVPLARDVMGTLASEKPPVDDDIVPNAWRGHPLPRVLHGIVSAFTALLSPADRAIFDLRFAGDLPRRTVGERIGISPMQVRAREEQIRQMLFDALAQAVDDDGRHAPDRKTAACAAWRAELARLLIDGNCKRCDELLVHVRGCGACRTLYDGFATIEPSDAVLEGDGGFRPDVDMHLPPRLAARISSVIPGDASEEVPWYARVSGHVISTVALTLAAFVAIAIVTAEDDGQKSAHVTEKPLVSLRVACVIGSGESRQVSVVDDTLPASAETGVRHDCPRGAVLAVTVKSSAPGRVLVDANGERAFGPDAVDGTSMRALTGTLPLTDASGSVVALRLVFVAGDIEDGIVVGRAEHPLPQDVVIERAVHVVGAL
jgi:DNA-directed RNA polymerase specialized sigma24 family protein